jgi:preprotein translocase subunit SecE
MNPKSEIQASKLDTFKLASAALILLVAVAAFYYFADYLLLVRVLGLLGAVGVAVAIALTTELGGNVLGFIKDARAELRRVVWPTRQETLQTTLAVVLMVIVVGIFLWLLDMLLFWIVRLLTSTGG